MGSMLLMAIHYQYGYKYPTGLRNKVGYFEPHLCCCWPILVIEHQCRYLFVLMDNSFTSKLAQKGSVVPKIYESWSKGGDVTGKK